MIIADRRQTECFIPLGEISPTLCGKLPVDRGGFFLLFPYISAANRITAYKKRAFARSHGEALFLLNQHQSDRRAENSVFSAAYRRVYSA